MVCASACFQSGALKGFFECIANPKFLKYLNIDPKSVESVLNSDFNCGYLAAIFTVAGLLILLLVIKIFLFFIFRTRKCSRVVIPAPEGNLTVSRAAIESVIRNDLAQYKELTIRKMLLYRTGKNYSIRLCCQFDSEGEGMPELTGKINPRIREVLKDLFGMERIRNIDICVEKIRENDDEAGNDFDEPSGNRYGNVVTGI